MQAAITIKGVGFSAGKTTIIANANSIIPAERFCVLLGTNGSGKSTLCKIIAGIHRRYLGEIHIFGKDARQLSNIERASKIGYLGQSFVSVFPFCVEDIVLTGAAAFAPFAPRQQDYDRLLRVLADMEIEHLRTRTFTSLSGGEQQLVLIARVLMQNPDILILDEPTNHLDIYYQYQLMHKLKALSRKQFTVFCVMHDPTLAFQFADHFLFIRDGKLICPSEEQRLSPDFLTSIYHIPFTITSVNGNPVCLPKQ